MKVVSISLNNGKIVTLKKEKIEYVNTNKVVDDTLFYTKFYIKLNKDKITNILKNYNISSVTFEDYDTFILLFPLLKVSDVKFNVKKSLTVKVMNMLLESESLKMIECNFIPSDYVSKFSDKDIFLIFTNEMKFDTDFIKNNDFKNYKSIYYKRVVNFYSESEILNNLEVFLSVNNSLKFINLYSYSDEVISFVIDKLNEYNMKDVNIFIYQRNNEEKLKLGNEHLRKINKKYSNKKREIKIIYTDEFFKENIFRELTINGIKLSMVIILYCGVIFMVSNKYHEYVALLNLRVLENKLREEANNNINIDDIDDTEVNPPVEETPEPDREPEYINYYANIPTNFESLLQINNDVKGWLSVNNTKANYPVTQSYDNEYYLYHDIYKRDTITGWIFMDYRNDSVNLSKNTIIYGHNLISGYMFGDLKKTTYYDWYTNPENQIITFNTLNREMKWKIFAMYKTDYTTDYLTTAFFNDEEFMNFINMIKSRSFYDFGVPVSEDDIILTLSTCTGNNDRRLAIHAVLVEG